MPEKLPPVQLLKSRLSLAGGFALFGCALLLVAPCTNTVALAFPHSQWVTTFFSVAERGVPLIRVDLVASIPLTAEQVRKINWLVDNKGQTAVIDQQLTNYMGLAQGSQNLTVWQYNERNNDGFRFSWNRIPNSGNILIGMQEPNAIVGGYLLSIVHGYLLSPEFRLLKICLLKPGQPPVTIPDDQAQFELDGNLKVWARIADRTTPTR